jgi:hypothetical protein
MFWFTTFFLSVSVLIPAALGIVSYDNDFVDPHYVMSKSFNTSTAGSQQTIVEWADQLAAQGPWSEQLYC